MTNPGRYIERTQIYANRRSLSQRTVESPNWDGVLGASKQTPGKACTGLPCSLGLGGRWANQHVSYALEDQDAREYQHFDALGPPGQKQVRHMAGRATGFARRERRVRRER